MSITMFPLHGISMMPPNPPDPDGHRNAVKAPAAKVAMIRP